MLVLVLQLCVFILKVRGAEFEFLDFLDKVLEALVHDKIARAGLEIAGLHGAAMFNHSE